MAMALIRTPERFDDGSARGPKRGNERTQDANGSGDQDAGDGDRRLKVMERRQEAAKRALGDAGHEKSRDGVADDPSAERDGAGFAEDDGEHSARRESERLEHADF